MTSSTAKGCLSVSSFKMSSIKLPEDLELQALDKFDALHSQGRLFFEETECEIIEHRGFKVSQHDSIHVSLLYIRADAVRQFEFRISQALTKKPILAHDAPERSGIGGPFLYPDPDFVVSRVGDGHILELNMHCMLRPMYILHTREFVPQDHDLDLDDFAAAHAVMANLGRRVPQMTIYNCGAEAGASQGHKHMQVFACPSSFPLFPEQAQSTQGQSQPIRP